MDEQQTAGDSAGQAGAAKAAAADSKPEKKAGAKKSATAAKPASKRKPSAKAGTKARAATVQLQLVRSPIGRSPAHRRTVAALGLRRIGHTIEKQVDPAVLGMVQQVRYMLRVDGQTLTDAGKDAAGD